MIGKNLDAIAEEDLRSLVTLGIAEGITLEFKQQLDLENKEEKREACKDVSALANTAGGRIVYGVVERKSHGPGVAEALHPLSDSGLRDRLGNVLLSGIHPRPRFRSVEVPAAAGGFYLVVEVYPSHAGDLHMVTGYDELRFYKRTDRGTYPMIEPEVREGYVRIAVSRMALDANLEKQVEEELRERSEARESIVVVPWYGSPSLVDPRQIGPLARWLRDGPLRDSDVVQHLVEPHLKVYSRGFRAVSAHGAHY